MRLSFKEKFVAGRYFYGFLFFFYPIREEWEYVRTFPREGENSITPVFLNLPTFHLTKIYIFTELSFFVPQPNVHSGGFLFESCGEDGGLKPC